MTIHLTIQLILMEFIRWTAIYPMDTAIRFWATGATISNLDEYYRS